MAFASLWLTVFIMFFPFTNVFPGLIYYSPLKYAALIALLLFYFSDSRNKQQVSFFGNKINIYFALFIVAEIISASRLWLIHGVDIFNFWLKYMIVYFLIIKSSISLQRIKFLLIAIVVAVIYISYFSLSNFIINYELGMRASGPTPGWYAGPNDIAVILVAIIPISYMLFETASNSLGKLCYLLLTGVFSLNLLFTGSRNGLIGLLVVGVLSLIFSKISNLSRVFLILLLCLSILGVGLTIVYSRSDVSTLSGDTSSENRIVQWKACMRMIGKHPLLGVGPFQSRYEMNNFGGIRGLLPHNTILQVFAEIGIPGGCFFLMFVVAPFFSFYKKKKNYISSKNNVDVVYKYLYISLSGFFVCAFFSNRVEGYLLYVLVAFFVATFNLIKSELPDEI